MVRASLRRGLAAAIVACLVLVSGPILSATGPPNADHGLPAFWTRLFDELRVLFGVSRPESESPGHFYAPPASESGPDDSGPVSSQTDSPTDNPELGQTIDPDG